MKRYREMLILFGYFVINKQKEKKNRKLLLYIFFKQPGFKLFSHVVKK